LQTSGKNSTNTVNTLSNQLLNSNQKLSLS